MAEKNVHQFRKSIDFIQPVSMVGEAAADFEVRQVERADDKYWSGLQEVKRYSVPEMEAIAFAAAKEMAVSMKAEVNQIAVTAHQAEQLVRDGKLSMVDFGDKKRIKEKLKELEGLSGFDKRKMVRFRQCAHDMLLVRNALESGERFGSVMGEKERAHLLSRDFFDLGDRRTNDLLKLYFKHSENDVLKAVNPASLNEKQIKRLKKSSEKNGFTTQDEAALRLVERQIKNREVRIKAGRMANIRKRIDWLKSYAVKMDENAGAGLQNVIYISQITQAGIAVAKFGLKAGLVTASFAGKYTGVTYLLHVLNRVRQKKMEQAANAVKTIVRQSKPYQAVVQKKEAVKKKINENPTVQRLKELQKQASAKRKEVSKKVQRTKAAAKAAGRRVKQAGNVVFSPVRFLGKVIHVFRGGLGKFRMFCMALAGAMVVVFLLLVVLINAILSVSSTEAETAFTYIMTEDDSFISSTSLLLQNKADARLETAKGKLTETPEDSAVYDNKALSKYGCPDGNGGWTAGGKIVYVDGNGNQILYGSNNSKDVIVASYILMDAEFDENVSARDALILDMWAMMNPDFILEESDIYTCGDGCDTFDYSCDSDADSAEITRLKNAGVKFYGSLEECEREPESDEPEDGEAEEAEAFSCSGHSISVCYGHKDLTVYVPVISMEEIFASGELPNAQGKSYQAFLQRFEGWTEQNVEWARSLYNSDWFELYGIDPSAGGDGTGLTGDQINAILDSYGSVDATRAALCKDAMSFAGRIPYYWGGKAVSKSYEGNSFYSTVTPDYKGRDKKGLDCSGFVQWTVWRVTDVKIGGSTSTITSGMAQIAASDLQPGDLGLMAIPGASSNHVGIFVGYDENGRALWCHENSSAGNVSVNTTTCFRYYYRIF